MKILISLASEAWVLDNDFEAVEIDRTRLLSTDYQYVVKIKKDLVGSKVRIVCTQNSFGGIHHE